MLLLTSTSDLIQIVTASAADIQVHASYVDNDAGTVTPRRQNTLISTATTTTVVPSPSSGVQRNVKGLYITNNHATTSCFVEVKHTDGTTTAEIIGVTLLPGENLAYREDGSWVHRDTNGAEYGFNPVVVYPYAPTGYKAESVPRTLAGVNIAGTSGTLFMQAIWLPAGTVINNLHTMSGTTASATQTNRWMALYDQNRNLIQQTANQTTTVLAANTIYTAALSPSYTTTYSGIYYIGFMTAATTTNSWIGVTVAGNAAIRGLTPILTGTSNTGLTTTAPNPANAITATVNSYWVAVS